MEPLRTAPGSLIAAAPDLLDPNFMHSVVLICQHSDQGAYGVVTNRPTRFKVKDLLPDHASLGQSKFPVFLGGPVDHTTLQFLHVVPEAIPGGLSIDGKLWLGGELDALGEYLVKNPRVAARKLRLFLGYSGWSAGQLDIELGTGSWLPAPPSLAASPRRGAGRSSSPMASNSAALSMRTWSKPPARKKRQRVNSVFMWAPGKTLRIWKVLDSASAATQAPAGALRTPCRVTLTGQKPGVRHR